MTFLIALVPASIAGGRISAHYHSIRAGLVITAAFFLVSLIAYYAITRRRPEA